LGLRGGGGRTAIYERKPSVRCKTTKVGEEADSIDGIRFGYERKVEEDTTYTRALLGSETERRRARRLRLRTAGPAHYAARGREAGPWAAEAEWAKCRGGAAGLRARAEKREYFLFLFHF
jgi:hypothetical protein